MGKSSDEEEAETIPKIFSSLSVDAVRKLVSQGDRESKKLVVPEASSKVEEDLIVQVIMVKYMTSASNKNMKARLMFSDGTFAVMAIMS